jgi:Tfp pilus assembly protein PilO
VDILVLPMVLAVGAIDYESIERQRDERRAEEQRERELQVINEQAQAVALQTYLDQMSKVREREG